MDVNTVNAQHRDWWQSGTQGFMDRQRALGTHGRFTPGRNQEANAPSTAFQNRLTNVLGAAEGLRNAVSSMTNENSAFNRQTPTSADTDMMTITNVNANRMRIANVGDFSVQVESLAQAQRNVGTSISNTNLATAEGFELGSNHIAITVGDRQFDINFSVSATDTVREVQNRIAEAINARSEIGVRATVEGAGASQLILQSANMGALGGFGVSGEAAYNLGIDQVYQEAQDATFRVNRGNVTGHLQSANTNDVDLGIGVTARLRDVGTVEVTMQNNYTGQVNELRNFVNQFNDLMDAARAGGTRNTRLERDLRGFAEAQAGALERVGITLNREGFMQIDQDRMQAAAESGQLERLASGGTLNRVGRIADNVANNPTAFIEADRNSGNNNNSNSFGFDPGNFSLSGHQSMQLNRITSTGMLFDSFM